MLLLGLALVVLQTVPLPPWLLGRLSPATADMLPLWNANGETPVWFGYWHCISFTPAETLAGLVIFLDYVLLFLVAAQRIRHIEDVERLLRWCALSAVAMASFGIVQLLFGNGKFYGGPFDIFPGADFRNGRLDLCVFPKVNMSSLLSLVPGFLARRKLSEHRVSRLRAEKFEVTSDIPAAFELDGEWIGNLPATFSVEPQKLRVVVP